jgi:SPP1 gp7 family putative phage head morphogenesis protein
MANPILPTLPSEVSGLPASTANETLVDLYMERAVDLLRLEAGTRDKVLVFLDELEKEIVGSIAKVDPTGTPDGARQRKRLTELLKVVRDSIKGTYRDVSTLMAREIRDIADSEAAWTGNAINFSTKAGFADAGITSGFLNTLVSNVLIQGAASSEWWSRQAGGMAERFADAMRTGIAIGESNSNLIDRVRNPATGLMNVSRSSAERLVRASVQAAANTAREAMYDKNSDLIQVLQWHATLDTRTTVMCLARDGHTYSPSDHKPKDGGPPWLQGPGKLHWGCRSTSVPILKSWRDLGIDMDEIPQTTRASMDGQVPAQTSFASWLKKQSPDRQDEILGAGKAQLYRDGKISVRDLLDQNGRPLTTEQLRAKASRR